MTGFFISLGEKEQKALLRRKEIAIFTAIVIAVPDPEQPEGRFRPRIIPVTETGFSPGDPWTDGKLNRISRLCRRAGDDFAPDMHDALAGMLGRRQHELGELRAGKIDLAHDPCTGSLKIPKVLRPVVGERQPWITLWCLAWTASMDGAGRFAFSRDDCFLPGSKIATRCYFRRSVYAADPYGITLENVMARMGRVHAILDRIVERFSPAPIPMAERKPEPRPGVGVL